MNVNFSTFLRVSADSREQLRPCDVDRVLSLAHDNGHGEEFRAWLLQARAFLRGTEKEIREWKPE